MLLMLAGMGKSSSPVRSACMITWLHALASAPGARHAHHHAPAHGTWHLHHPQVTVSSADLPDQLCERIAQTLKSKWTEGIAAVYKGPAEGPPQPAPFRLALLPQLLQSNWVKLITTIPQLVEPYESVDTHGATARRCVMVMALPCKRCMHALCLELQHHDGHEEGGLPALD